jgi:hypothetical protein
MNEFFRRESVIQRRAEVNVHVPDEFSDSIEKRLPKGNQSFGMIFDVKCQDVEERAERKAADLVLVHASGKFWLTGVFVQIDLES